MSYATSKGYRGERDTLVYLASHDLLTRRPRTTALPGIDTGDLEGLPLVISVKNWSRTTLGGWVDELADMVGRSPWQTGVVVHKRPGRGPADMYVTTSLSLLVPLVHGYINGRTSS